MRQDFLRRFLHGSCVRNKPTRYLFTGLPGRPVAVVMIGSLLFATGLIVAITYFFLFNRMMTTSSEEAEKYVREFSGKRRAEWIVPLLVLGALIFQMPEVSLALFLAAIVLGSYFTLRDNKRMTELDFSTTFRRRLLRISALVPVAIAFFVAGQLIRSS